MLKWRKLASKAILTYWSWGRDDTLFEMGGLLYVLLQIIIGKESKDVFCFYSLQHTNQVM